MRTIFKYDIPSAREFKITLPVLSKVLSIQIQDGYPVIWVMRDDAFKNVNYVFRSFTTGEQIPEHYTGSHVGTIQLGKIVLHIFQDFTTEEIAEPEKLQE